MNSRLSGLGTMDTLTNPAATSDPSSDPLSGAPATQHASAVALRSRSGSACVAITSDTHRRPPGLSKPRSTQRE